jgi:hypothetical protein
MGFFDKLLGRKERGEKSNMHIYRESLKNDLREREEANYQARKLKAEVKAEVKARHKKPKAHGLKTGNTGLFASNLLGGSGGYDYRPPVYEISGGKGNPLFPNIDIWENTKKRKRR